MQAITTEKDIFMTYKLIPGYVKQSHAFQVAHMAGLPNAVIEQAQQYALFIVFICSFYNLLSKENHEYKELSNAIDSLYSTNKEQTPIITPQSQPSSQVLSFSPLLCLDSATLGFDRYQQDHSSWCIQLHSAIEITLQKDSMIFSLFCEHKRNNNCIETICTTKNEVAQPIKDRSKIVIN